MNANYELDSVYFTRPVVESRGLISPSTDTAPSGPRPCGKLLLTKDTISYSMFRQTDRDRDTNRESLLVEYKK